MKLKMKAWLFYLAVLLALLGPIRMLAQMTGEKVLEDCIEAIGGKTAYEKIQNCVIESTLELASQGIKVKSIRYQAMPNLYYLVMEPEPGNGKIERGFDGEVAWEISSSGSLILEGEEKWLIANFSRLDFIHKWQEILAEVRLEGEERFEGQPCYVVTLIPKKGPVITAYYSKKSKLCIRNKFIANTQFGSMSTEIHSFKYKKIDGILVAINHKMKMAGKDFTVTIDNIKFNVKMPENRFKLPDAIRSLLKEKQDGS